MIGRQIGEVDIHRQAGHGAEEQVDGRAAFEGETGMPLDFRQAAQKQLRLANVERVKHFGSLPVWGRSVSLVDFTRRFPSLSVKCAIQYLVPV